jgi:hypothetical protein
MLRAPPVTSATLPASSSPGRIPGAEFIKYPLKSNTY